MMKVSALPTLFIQLCAHVKEELPVYTSANLAISGFPTAIMMACTVPIVPERECSSTADVLLDQLNDHKNGGPRATNAYCRYCQVVRPSSE